MDLNQLKPFIREKTPVQKRIKQMARSGSTHVVLCKFNLDDFWVSVDGLLRIEQLLGVGQPGHQLCQRVLELTEGQEGGFELVLSDGRRRRNV